MNYLKTEKNDLNQDIGIKLLPEDSTPLVYEAHDLIGTDVKILRATTELVTEEMLTEIYRLVETETNTGCFTYLPYMPIASKDDLRERFKNLFEFPESYLFVIIDNCTDNEKNSGRQQPLGWISLTNQRSKDRAIEVGNVYFSHLLRHRKGGTECIYLLLKSCFEQKYRRVDWKCDSLNLPSSNAAQRFGFTFEVLLRQDRVIKGRNRNISWFSILDDEWPFIEQAYISWLDQSNFDKDGNQIQKLSDLISSKRLEISL